MKVSIMITTYNLEKYIRKTLDSVLSQITDFDFEILVGDDGSKDHTIEIIDEYKKQYPEKMQLFVMPREEGISYNKVERSALNRLNLWRHAKGEYASFLDGDDFYLDQYRLQKMVDILDNPENQDCSMCAHNLLMHYENSEDFPLCRAKKEQKLTFKAYWKLMFIQANALLFRNNYQEKKPEGAVANNFDDNNITYWFFQFGKMYYLPECMGAYRQLEGSSWNSNDELKKNCSNMIGYNIEQLIMPQNERISNIRHYQELKFLLEHKEELNPDRCSPFYQTAEANNLQIALAIYQMKNSDAEIKIIKKKVMKAGLDYKCAKLGRAVKKLFGKY